MAGPKTMIYTHQHEMNDDHDTGLTFASTEPEIA